MSKSTVRPRCLGRVAIAAAVGALLLAVPSRAHAAPIGSETVAVGAFSYDVDSFFGPTFTIENFFDSPGTFSNIVVQLFLGATDVLDLSIPGDVSPTASPFQTTDDLTGLSFDSAVLSFTFSLPGTIVVDALTGLTFDSASLTGSTATTAINFTPEPTQNVPEPSTLLLLATGAGLAFKRQRSHTQH